MPNNIKYAHVGDNSSDYEEDDRRPGQQKRQWVSLLSSFIIGLATMGVVMALYSTLMMPNPSQARNLPYIRNGSDPATGLPLSWSHGDCGNSPEDAKARDCRYSIVLHAWLPQSCLTDADTEDAKDMYKDRNWNYTTASGQNITTEELGAGDYEHFVTAFDWHVTHCIPESHNGVFYMRLHNNVPTAT
ncbi:hypothetical protein FSARC_5612 [Fusarium sarcochroum]|uniref:Uncharacterized protein n=1 Tax=Fusarium sarcochroum TaxID=1208366 RepID=A0A8H4TZ66_9HYPO|nr:hypothetical protein FSARC_5612 [Fusarium sarcochroum]